MHGSSKLRQALPAILYHLENILPRGGTACVLFPKKILSTLLPKAAVSKNCEILLYGSPTKELRNFKVVKEIPKADVYIIEPDGFTEGGALVRPEETPILAKLDCVGVGSVHQWTEDQPAEYDFVEITKYVTEKGVHSKDNFNLLLP